MMLVLLVWVSLVHGYWDSDLEFEELLSGRRTEINLLENASLFQSLQNYEVGATEVSEMKYPWVARVVHSRNNNEPHVCTAACIDKGIFITAARCLHSLKINYTGIRYGYRFLDPVAFVLPSSPSRQAFDDIGFLIVDPDTFTGKWATIAIIDQNRTDDNFGWFKGYEYTHNTSDVSPYKVIGYAIEKHRHRGFLGSTPHDLHELKVVIGVELCFKIIGLSKMGFHVPCYFSCTEEEFTAKDPKCSNYLGAEGCAIIDERAQKLIGVATWGPIIAKYELPVGMAVANSDNFFEDYSCARKIRDKSGVTITENYFQKLCDGKN